MNPKGLLISTDDRVETVALSTEEGVTGSLLTSHMLYQLQGYVDGYVETVHLGNSLTMWVNEYGKVHGLAPNRIASRLFRSVFGAYDIIVGNAVLTGGTDENGDVLGLDDKTWVGILTWITYPSHTDIRNIIQKEAA